MLVLELRQVCAQLQQAQSFHEGRLHAYRATLPHHDPLYSRCLCSLHACNHASLCALQLAAIVGPVALFCAVLPRYLFFNTNRFEAAGAKYLWSLSSPTAFAFAADIVADYEVIFELKHAQWIQDTS